MSELRADLARRLTTRRTNRRPFRDMPTIIRSAAPTTVIKAPRGTTGWDNIRRWLRSFVSVGRAMGRRLGLFAGASRSDRLRQTWDAQYSAGQWSRLRDLVEVPHNSVILGLLDHLKPDAAVLDVGCGEGVLFSAIRTRGYKRYLGIDISPVAIEAIAGEADEHTAFVATDAETFVPAEPFDAIIFNESLYYLRDPLPTLRRYARHLTPDGILIVSIFHETPRMQQLLHDAKNGMAVVADVTVTMQGAVWGVLALAAGRT